MARAHSKRGGACVREPGMGPIRFVASALILAIPAAVQAQATQPAIVEVPLEPSLVVSGTADLSRPPDEAELVVGAVVQAKSAAQAQAAVNQTMNRTLEAIKLLGVPDRNIRTAGVSIQPVYSATGEQGDMPIEGYRALNTVEVSVPPERVGPVLDAALREKANRVEGISFGISDDTAAQGAVLRDAFMQARAKAQALAAAGGFELAGVLEVVETVAPMTVRDRGWSSLRALDVGSTPIEPGELGVTGNVSVRFAIRRSEGQRVQTRGETPSP